MFFGRYTQGQFVMIEVVAVDGNNVAFSPATAAFFKVYDSGGSTLFSSLMVPLDKSGATGLFSFPLRLDASYPVGQYNVSLMYDSFLQAGGFEVVGGGDQDGAVISQHHYERPQSANLVQRLDSDQRILGRNPGV